MRATGTAFFLTGLVLAILAGCTPNAPFGGASPARFSSQQYPQQLSAWRLIHSDGRTLTLNPEAMAYDVNMPLFSDYAAKYRTLWLPDQTRASVREDGALELPVGSIISKTFFYPSGHAGRTALTRVSGSQMALEGTLLLETRLLVKQAGGWEALTYLWRDDDAYLTHTGAIIPVQRTANTQAVFNYIVPTRNECASCHALNHRSGQLEPIGLKASQLTVKAPTERESALQRIVSRGWLNSAPQVHNSYAIWEDDLPRTADLTQHARDYLDSNCAHCHSDVGPAKNSALDLRRSTDRPRSLGICKPPIAAGKGSGGRPYSIVPGSADASILSYRLHATDPSRRMPEIGRSLAHVAGAGLIDRWIETLTGNCL